jgi:hypothetical protein
MGAIQVDCRVIDCTRRFPFPLDQDNTPETAFNVLVYLPLRVVLADEQQIVEMQMDRAMKLMLLQEVRTA